MNKLKYTIILSVFLVSINSYGQITLDYDSFTDIGDSIVEHYDSNPNALITIGEEGENITWDFTTLETDFTDTLAFIKPRKTLFYKEFKDATIAIKMASTDSVSLFFQHNDNALSLIHI